MNIVTGDLQKNPIIGSTFVGLSRRMQKAGAKTKARSYLFGITNGVTNFLQTSFVFLVHLNVGKQGEVVPRLDAIEVGLEVPGKIPAVYRACILCIGEQLDTRLLK